MPDPVQDIRDSEPSFLDAEAASYSLDFILSQVKYYGDNLGAGNFSDRCMISGQYDHWRILARIKRRQQANIA